MSRILSQMKLWFHDGQVCYGRYPFNQNSGKEWHIFTLTPEDLEIRGMYKQEPLLKISAILCNLYKKFHEKKVLKIR